MQGTRAVVLRDEVDYPLRKADLPGKLLPVGHVADYYFGALSRLEAVVRVGAGLVLNKVLRRGSFADIVIESADTRKQAVGPHGSASFFGKLADRV